MAGGKNKPKGPSSSARAAAFFNKNAGSDTSPGLLGSGAVGFSFGSAFTPEHSKRQLDPEIAQCLKHVTKRDEVTKVKALSTLLSRFKQLEPEDAAELMPAWLFAFKRVSVDNARAVRLGGNRALSQIVQQAGRKIAPHLKDLMGCWWLALHDTYPEARQVALTAFQACFTTLQKRRQVLVHVRMALVAHLRDCLFASPDDLGEPSKESTEQLEDRHQRVCTQVMLALAGIVQLFPVAKPTSAARSASEAADHVATLSQTTPSGKGDAPRDNSADPPPASCEECESMLQALAGMWEESAFWERALQDSQPPVYNAACHLVTQLVQLQHDTAQQLESMLAPLIFSSLKSLSKPCQASGWTMALRFTSACPGALSIPAVSSTLPKQISAALKAGKVDTTILSRLVPLAVLMLRQGPPGWAQGDLRGLWLPAALKGFQNAPAAALNGAAEALAGLLLVMVPRSADADTLATNVASEVVTEAAASAKAVAWGRALWAVLSSYITSPETRFHPAGDTILMMYCDVTRDRLADGDAAVSESMAGQVAVLADLASAAAAPPHAAQLVRSSLLLPLERHLRQQAEQAALSHVQAQTLQTLVCSRGSGSVHGDSAGDSCALLRAAVSRMLMADHLDPPGGQQQSQEVAADLLVVQALLHSGMALLPAVLDAALLHVLPPPAGGDLQRLLTPGHTLKTFSAACKPLMAAVPAAAAENLSSFVQLVLEGHSDGDGCSGDVPQSTSGEGILLLLLGHAMLPQGSTAGAALLRTTAASALQRPMPAASDAGLLYMLGVLFRDAASAASGAASDVSAETAQALLRAPVLVPSAAHCCRACMASPAALRPAASVAHCESIMCSIFELAVPHMMGATRTSGAVPGARALQTTAAATWQQLVQPLTTAAGALTPDLPAQLMRLLVLWHSRCAPRGDGGQQSPWTVSPAQVSELMPGVASPAGEPATEAGDGLAPLCLLAGATASTALGILDVACGHSDETAVDAAVSALLQPPHGAAASPTICSSGPRELQVSLPRPQLLLAASVVLRSRQLRVLQSIRGHLPWLALVVGVTDNEWPAGFRHGLIGHVLASPGSGADEAGEVCRQLLRLALAADDSSPVALASLMALLTRDSPAISSAAVHASASCAPELTQHVVATSDGRPGVGVQVVSALAPHICLQARSADAAAAAVRDEVAVVILQDLCKRVPLLAEHATVRAPDEVQAAGGVAAAMQCVAQLYVPAADSPDRVATDPESAQLLSILVGGEAPLEPALASAAKGSDSAALQPEGPGLAAGAPAEDGEGGHPDVHAALVYPSASQSVHQAFRTAVAHQLRPARAVAAMATAAPEAAGSVLGLLLAASTVAHLSREGEVEGAQLLGLVEARLAAATVAVEGRTEDMCEALVAASAQLAGGPRAAEGEEGSAEQRIATVMELGWSDPRKAGVLLASVQEGAAGPVAMDSAALVAVELFMQLRELQKHGGASEVEEEGGGVPAVVQRIERLLLRLLLCAGTCMHVARMVQAPAETAARWLPGSVHFWQVVAQAGLLHVDDASAARAVEEFTAWSEELGVPAMHAALGLLQYKETSAAMHAAGARIALSPALLVPASDIDFSGEDATGEGAGGDNASTLAAVGVDAALAQALSGCQRLSVSDCDAPLLVWSVALALVEGLANDARRRLAVALAACDPPLVPAVLDLIVLLLPSADAAPGGGFGDASQQGWGIASHVRATLCVSGLVAPWHTGRLTRLSAYDLSTLSVGIFRSLLRQIPAALRSWFSMLKDAQLAAAVEEYTRRRESPPLLQQDIRAAALVESGGMAITASGTAREVVAAMEVDDGVMIELAIRLPPSYPLQPAEVSLRKKVAIQERSVRRWLLSIAAYLRSQNCSLADAVLLWKSNVDQEFAGVEPCMICYAVVNPSDRSLPRMPCKTCSQVFHSICLYKWFKSRSKSVCPHCQCPW